MSDEQPIIPSNHPLYTGFVAGTLIMTTRGPVPIEKLEIGDMIRIEPIAPEQPPETEDDGEENEFPWWEAN